jgi:hypothetical protein
MNRLTENRTLGVFGAVVVAGSIAVAAVAIGLTGARSDNPNQDKQDVVNHSPPDPSQAENHSTKPFDSSVPTPVPLADGIYGGSQAPYSTEEFTSKNMWVGHASGLRILVDAGAEGHSIDDAGRGLLMVDTYSDQVPGGSYVAPSGVGPLHIVSCQGTVLTIQASTGETFYFDAESRAFTDADGNPVPTDMPTAKPAT